MLRGDRRPPHASGGAEGVRNGPVPASREGHGFHGKADERAGLCRARGVRITPGPQDVDRKGDGVRALAAREVVPAGWLVSTTRARGRGRGGGR